MGHDPAIPEIRTERLRLTIPAPDAAPLVAAYFAATEEHLSRWVPPRPAGFATEGYWRERLTAARREFAEGRSVRLFLFEPGGSGRVLGDCSLSEIVRGPFQSCFLGYAIDGGCEARGLMTEAVRAVIHYAFDELRLHRIQANYVPTNERSGRLLRRLGFTVEGYARDYLYIDGAWRDHVMAALVNPALERPER